MQSHYLYLAAVSLTAILIASLRPVATCICLVDRPNHHRLHSREVPFVGSIAIYNLTCRGACVNSKRGVFFGRESIFIDRRYFGRMARALAKTSLAVERW